VSYLDGGRAYAAAHVEDALSRLDVGELEKLFR
jgi:hypothetical protein